MKQADKQHMQRALLEIPSHPDEITQVEEFLERSKSTMAISEEIYGNIVVAITEAVINAIVHGNKQNESKQVKIEMITDEDSLHFIIEDQGQGFDHKSLPDPTAPENLLDLGGRGVFLMKHLSDEIKFEENGSQVKMTFYYD